MMNPYSAPGTDPSAAAPTDAQPGIQPSPQQRQALIQALVSRGTQGQMVGNRYVPPSTLGQASGAISPILMAMANRTQQQPPMQPQTMPVAPQGMVNSTPLPPTQ